MTAAGWDAARYEQIADPQAAWAAEILERAAIAPHERVLDAGCGGGRVTTQLVECTPHVVAVDADAAMVEQARDTLPEHVEVLRQDLLDLRLDEPVDVVFSCAVFHWITDHERLFSRLRAVLCPGGRLVAQCGGHGNLAQLLEHAPDREGQWLYATPQDTERRLRDAGFSQVRAWLEPRPTRVDDLVGYLETVVFRAHADARDVAERVAPRIDHLDYVRLNMEATA